MELKGNHIFYCQVLGSNPLTRTIDSISIIIGLIDPKALKQPPIPITATSICLLAYINPPKGQGLFSLNIKGFTMSIGEPVIELR